MKWWQGGLLGLGLGLLAAPFAGALIGGLYGVPLPCEPGWMSGVGGLFLGAMLYGIFLFIPTALVGAVAGGAVAANRRARRRGNCSMSSNLLPSPCPCGQAPPG
jgi:hypothetical protein